MKSLRIAVWGLGGHAINRILPSIDKVREISLIGVCSRSRKIVKEVSKKWDCNFWTDPNEMLRCEDIDVVYISTPIGIHFELSKLALKAGKHVWCEKPLTCDFLDTQFLIKLASKNNKMLCESFMYLYHPQFDKVRSFIIDNKFGKIKSIVCRFGIPKLEKPSFRNDVSMGGGAFWDVASYTISAVTSLFPNEQVTVQFSEINGKKNNSVDTDGRAILYFSNDVRAYLEWATNIGYKNEIDLWSENGSFYTDKIFSKPIGYRPIYIIKDKHGKEMIQEGSISDQFSEMFRKFYKISLNQNSIKMEYKAIEDRARVMNDIFMNSHSA